MRHMRRVLVVLVMCLLALWAAQAIGLLAI